MNAAGIIELIKKLPPKEQAEVAAFVRAELGNPALKVEDSSSAYSAAEAKVDHGRIPLVKAERVAAQVFDQHSELFRKLAQ